MGHFKNIAIEQMEREEYMAQDPKNHIPLTEEETAHINQQADEYAASLEYQAACEEAEQWEAERARLNMTD